MKSHPTPASPSATLDHTATTNLSEWTPTKLPRSSARRPPARPFSQLGTLHSPPPPQIVPTLASQSALHSPALPFLQGLFTFPPVPKKPTPTSPTRGLGSRRVLALTMRFRSMCAAASATA